MHTIGAGIMSLVDPSTVQTMQAVETATSAYALIDRGGVIATLLLGIVFIWTAFQFGWIVPGRYYDKLEVENTKLRDLSSDTIKAINGITEEFREQRLREAAAAQQRTGRGAR